MRSENEGVVRKFLKAEDPRFVKACEEAKLKVTRRQAAKWLKQKGKAFKTMRGY
jgi:hypothetical protein